MKRFLLAMAATGLIGVGYGSTSNGYEDFTVTERLKNGKTGVEAKATGKGKHIFEDFFLGYKKRDYKNGCDCKQCGRKNRHERSGIDVREFDVYDDDDGDELIVEKRATLFPDQIKSIRSDDRSKLYYRLLDKLSERDSNYKDSQKQRAAEVVFGDSEILFNNIPKKYTTQYYVETANMKRALRPQEHGVIELQLKGQ